MNSLVHDLRYAWRSLLRTPGLTAIAVLCLALGIGANAAIFGVVDTLLFRAPSGVEHPELLRRLFFKETFRTMGTFTQSTTEFPVYQAMLTQVPAFAQVAAFTQAGSQSLGRGPDAEDVAVQFATASYFPVLGVHPALGRFFDSTEDKVGGPAVAVISWGFWQRKFGGARDVIGKTLPLGTRQYQILGVAPERFSGANLEKVDIWVPIQAAAADLQGPHWLEDGYYWMDLVARLKSPAVEGSAVDRMTVAFRAVNSDRSAPDTLSQGVLAPIQEARGPDRPRSVQVSAWLAAVSFIVLLIACGNVINIFLARTMDREREIAIRATLGAGRGRLVRQVLVESVVLSVIGGAAALLLTLWTGPLIGEFLLPDLPDLRAPLDLRVVLFTLGVTLATGIAVGIIPAFGLGRRDLTPALKAGVREGRQRKGWARSTLLAGQVALTLLLLAGAGLFIRSLRNAKNVNLGFDADHLVLASLDLRSAGYKDPDITALYLRMLDLVRQVPGVGAAAAAVGSPFGFAFATKIKVPGLDSFPHVKSGGPYFGRVTSDYFAALGATVRGRAFNAGDRAGAPPVAVVGETFAKTVWPGQDPIGKCFYVGDDRSCYAVVGVAPDAHRYAAVEDPSQQYFVPLDQAQADNPISTLLIRTTGPSGPMIEPIRRAIEDAAPGLPFASVVPMADKVAPSIRPWRMGSTMFSLFGALALILAATGLYGVLAYTVSQRTHEIGVRMALGAREQSVLGLIIRRGLGVTVIGVAIGLAGAVIGGRALESLLYGVTSADPLVLTGGVMTLLAAAFLASWLPARRAARVDPMTALRYE